MKLRRWTGALAAAFVLAACSGDGGDTEGAGNNGQQAGGAAGDEDPETRVEQFRDEIHETDPELCGTTGEEPLFEEDESIYTTAAPDRPYDSIYTTDCWIHVWDPAVTDSESVSTGNLTGTSAVLNEEEGWLITSDEEADPRDFIEHFGGDILSWPAADPPSQAPWETLRQIHNVNDPRDRCEDTTDRSAESQREENRSISLDNGGCLIYVWSPMLTDEELEQLKQDAIATAEAEDASLRWGTDRYVMSRDTDARGMNAAIGGFEILVE